MNYFNTQLRLPDVSQMRHDWYGLHGSSKALAISEAIKNHANNVVILCQDIVKAQQLQHEIAFYHGPGISFYPYPDWETLPYDNFSPHQDIISQRLSALNQLAAKGTKQVFIIPVATMANRLPPEDYIVSHTFVLRCGDQLNVRHLRERLLANGYNLVSQVMHHGEFAIRGSIIDLYPMASEQPFRLDLFDHEIDSIRIFDPDSQRSIDKLESINLLPAHEFPLNEAGITRFRMNFREQFNVDPQNCPIYEDVSQGLSPAGCEYYLPLFFEHTNTLFDYCDENTLFITVDDLHGPMEKFWHEVVHRYQQLGNDIRRPILKPNQLFISTDEFFGQLKTRQQIKIVDKISGNGSVFDTRTLPDVTIDNALGYPLQRLKNLIEQTSVRVLITAETQGRREALLELCRKSNINITLYNSFNEFINDDRPVGMVVAGLTESTILSSINVAIIAEQALFGHQVMQRRRRKQRYGDPNRDAAVKNLAELRLGSPVVHIEHGIGRYLGLKTIAVGDSSSEYLHLEYADKSNLYVPVSSLHLISRYGGTEVDNAPLHKLGSGQWEKTRKKAAEQIRDVAVELLQIYARRKARLGHAFKIEDEQYEQFSGTFPFEETPDQAKAIDDVVADLKAEKAMDRLVCGDVGFGKTEVAMRAAFVCANAGKQVAMLVPTTLLAQQHYESFMDRFANWPFHIELLSRFRTSKNQKSIIDLCKDGKVDIIIGTHKLLSKEIGFKNLGLLIIDEEHRFGVRQKEKLKQLRSEVDLLTLTATPIPRTLNMALSGLRDLSIISTPPQRRLAVKTFVRPGDKHLVREAILREIMRGGQVYYLHNDVKSIARVAIELEELIPQARISIGHGQMPERELEQVMSDFYHQRFNVLLCTTIIETGIDVPTANTIIIDRADKLGLAQLHQLRGRVGRSHHQAYAYLLTPPPKAMTTDANKRLEAIGQLEDLGAGFSLASHDLEIRGAGELLGEEQSGNIHSVGINLYMDMLDRAVKALKSGQVPDNLDQPMENSIEVELKIPALIPADYLPDVHSRLVLYKRIANAASEDELIELRVEMIDRFGDLPDAAQNLFSQTLLKLQARALGIKKVDGGGAGLLLEFVEKPNFDPSIIIKLIQGQPTSYQLEGPKKLRYRQTLDDAKKRLAALENILKQLESSQGQDAKYG